MHFFPAAIGDGFDKYMAEFSVLLFASLQNIAVHQVSVVQCNNYMYLIYCTQHMCVIIHMCCGITPTYAHPTHFPHACIGQNGEGGGGFCVGL